MPCTSIFLNTSFWKAWTGNFIQHVKKHTHPFAGDALRKFADDLVTENLITHDQLILAKASEQNLGIDIGHILIARGFIKEEALLEFVAKKINTPIIQPTDDEIDVLTLQMLPFEIAKKHLILPVYKNEANQVTVIMSDPNNPAAKEEMRGYFPDGVNIGLATPKFILDLLQKKHENKSHDALSNVALEMETGNSDDLQTEVETRRIQEIASGPKIISAVNNIIANAKKDAASDIHIEPFRETVRVRYRVDGVLIDKGSLPKSMHMALVSRIKIMGGLDIAERRTPQDGKSRVTLMGRPLDLRISTLPTQFGEKIVMRLFATDNSKTIDSLGFNKEDQKKFLSIIGKPNGIFLVTGPTGSGKSSTLYAGLQRINSPDINIMTIEDPVESEVAGINQVAINPKTGLTFASVLRSALRQDPDVIMLGEIRDGETAEIATRAAITGHMVLSTLHTNTAAGAIDRLKDMGIEPFMIASALRGVLAQRLVRTICQNCKVPVPTENEYNIPIKKAFKGKGCEKCKQTGFTGRIGIFEILSMDRELRELIHKGAGEGEIDQHLRSHGVPSIMEDGIQKVEDGLTTIDEVLRVTMADWCSYYNCIVVGTELCDNTKWGNEYGAI